MRRLSAGLLLGVVALAIAMPATAQNAITQEGPVLQNSPTMFRGDRRVRQGATVDGAPTGKTVTTGDSVVGGRCDYSAPTDDPAGYKFVCLDAKNSAIRVGGSGAPTGFTITVDGTAYAYPQSAAIVGSDAIVGSNAALKLATGAVGKRLTRLGFTAPGDGGAALYNWSASNCAAADNGAQVQPTAITGCWIADFDAVQANVRQWGAKGDCATDDAPAFVAAGKIGRKVHIPEGHFLFSTPFVTTALTEFEGEGFQETGLAYGETCSLSRPGSYIVQKNSSFSLFALSGTEARGSSFDNVAINQLQPAPGSGWSPTAYPPVWALNDLYGGISLSRIGLGGVYSAVDAGGNTWRVSLDKISGQVFSYLLRTDVGADISRAREIHLWPFWSTDANVITWQYTNSDVFYFRRQDGFSGDDVFALPARSCVRIGEGLDGVHTGTNIHFNNLNCDVAKYSVLIDSNSLDAAVSIDHLWHGGGDLSGVPIPGGNVIQINGASAGISAGDINVLLTAQSIVNQTNATLGSRVDIGLISASGFPTHGWNYSGGVAYAGTYPVIVDNSPQDGHSIYSIAHPIFPQNGSSNAGSGFNSGIINANSNAELYVPSNDQAWSNQVITNGGTYAWPNWASMLILSGAVSGATVTLPKSSLDGRLVTLACDNAITTLTVTAAPGSSFSLINPPTSCTAGQSFQFKTTLAGVSVIRTLK